MRSAQKAGLAAAAIAALLAGCAPAEITPATVTYVEEHPTDRTFAPAPPDDPVPAVAWPLTGVDASGATDDARAIPAIAIKIPNDAKAQPHYNLEFADIVFEQYVEGGVPRFVAVYHSNIPETVGPVRSMREMDPNIVGSFGGPLVFSGANPNVLGYAKGTGQKLLSEDTGNKGFFRTKDRVAPYNLHVRLATILEQSTELSAPAPQFSFAYPADTATAALEGTPTSHIDLRFSGHGEPGWDWDEASGTWLRTQFGDPHVSAAGTRLSATNVIVLHVTVKTHWALPVSEMIVSNAPGYVATGGKYIPILWSKADRTAPYVITTEDGRPVQLAPGQTWIELIPNAGVKGAHAKFE